MVSLGLTYYATSLISGTTSRKAKAYDLESVTKPLSHPVATNLTTMAIQRIYKAECELL